MGYIYTDTDNARYGLEETTIPGPSLRVNKISVDYPHKQRTLTNEAIESIHVGRRPFTEYKSVLFFFDPMGLFSEHGARGVVESALHGNVIFSPLFYNPYVLANSSLNPFIAFGGLMIEWSGNDWGEMLDPTIKISADSDEFSDSSIDIKITDKTKIIPQSARDARELAFIYEYDGVFDPAGFGKYTFSGKFCIDAWGNLWFQDATVTNQSSILGGPFRDPYKYVLYKKTPADITKRKPIPDIQRTFYESHGFIYHT